jgi:hypothetical protein
MFEENFRKYRKINKEIMQNICNFFIDFQCKFSNEINYIKRPEFFTNNLNDCVNILF